MRTGAWMLRDTLPAATASADAAGNTRPIASRMGKPSMTPAPRRNVRRGILQLLLCTIIGNLLLWIETMLKRKAGRNLFNQHRRAIAIFPERLHRPVNDAIIELV